MNAVFSSCTKLKTEYDMIVPVPFKIAQVIVEESRLVHIYLSDRMLIIAMVVFIVRGVLSNLSATGISSSLSVPSN
jgi:hypothetical protein